MVTDRSTPPADPLDRALKARIPYRRFDELESDILQCQTMSKKAGEAHCMSLEGESGAGKSTLAQHYAKQFQRIETPDGTQVPVFYVQVPSPATVKGLAAAILEKLGDPAAHSGTLWSMNFRLAKLLVACKTELVILDDIHHLIDRDTDRVLRTVSDWLKVLIKETKVPFLIVGIPNTVDRILQENEQLARLFPVRERLEPFPWDNGNSRGDFTRFVEDAARAISLRLDLYGLPREELLLRIHCATGGRISYVMALLRYATQEAVRQQQDCIDARILAKVFDKYLLGRIIATNPFAQSIGDKFTLPDPPVQNKPNGVGNRGRKRKRES